MVDGQNRERELADPETDPANFKFPEEGLDLPLNSNSNGEPKLDLPLKSDPTEFPLNPLAGTKEFKFYQDHFEGAAKRHNERRFIDRLVEKAGFKNDKKNRPKKITKEYVMQEAAERENKDFDKRLDEERKEWDKRLRPVIEAMRLKRDDPEGEGKKRKVLVLALAAGLRGGYGGGQEIALNKMGYTSDKMDVLVGASSGKADILYYAAGPEQTLIGNSIYYDECNTKEFLDVTRLSGVMDSRVAARAMRSGEKAVDQEAIRRNPAEVYAIVTPIDGSQAELVNIKTATPDMIAPVEASMNVRLLWAAGTKVNGKEYEDGGFGSFAIQELIDRFHPTDILVLPNIPFDKIENFKRASERVESISSAGTLGTLKKFFKIATELRNMLEEFKEKEGVNIGVLWPPNAGLDTMDSDPHLIQMGIKDSALDTFRQFGEEPQEIELYIPKKFRNQSQHKNAS
jgi:predicted patatin/cPLA2 family phospholipase